MSRYHLSEAYSNLYNPRLQENFDDNLQFIDYMLDEDIEEVVESLFWEFRDYGHSIEEAIDLLKECASTEVITESMEVLSESKRFTDKQLQNRKANNARLAAERDANVRKQTRKARVDGAISRVKSAWKGAAGGMGKAKEALSGGAKKASEYVSDKRKAGMAKLTSLMRTGAQAFRRNVSAPAQRTMRNITGETARTNDLKRKLYGAKKAANSAANRATQSNAFATSPSSSGTLALPPARRTREERIAANRARNAANAPSGGGGAIGPERTSSVTPTGGKRNESSVRANLMRAAEGEEAKKQVINSYKKLRNQAAGRLGETTGLSYTDSFSLTDIIINDLIAEGYAQDEYDAVNLIMTLNEDTIYDITQEYLFD